ncbi:hypothetical protein DL766_009274 [Monosporascus sp. MC13-8B]|uniref:Uncharacterized protein n=1 Tax=Monosporascus cannonballus TaxID=155416 RepID=A0ABY0GQN6_9PEZI|nr:hypothetical protein DL762_010583 [Monosporascus cannonballus]RYO88887.1 hypothetical protein DL763_005850 [Monosporascus cannonballus]RYP15922.1 hypothetical protein DL766_009274 [Monosporascus sp. MC13-8B]
MRIPAHAASLANVEGDSLSSLEPATTRSASVGPARDAAHRYRSPDHRSAFFSEPPSESGREREDDHWLFTIERDNASQLPATSRVLRSHKAGRTSESSCAEFLPALSSPTAKNEDLGHDRLGEEFAQEKTPAPAQHLRSIVTETTIAKAVRNLRSLGRRIGRRHSRSSTKSTRSDFPAPQDGKERRLLSRYPADAWPSSGDETPIYNTPESHELPFLQNFPAGSYIDPLATGPVTIAIGELDRLSSRARRSGSRSEAALSGSSASTTATRRGRRRRTASRLSEVMYT